MLLLLGGFLLVLAGLCVVYWAINKFDLPAPVKVVAIAVLALIGLFLLYHLLVGVSGYYPRY